MARRTPQPKTRNFKIRKGGMKPSVEARYETGGAWERGNESGRMPPLLGGRPVERVSRRV